MTVFPTFSNFQQAEQAAQNFFFEIFQEKDSVGVQLANGQIVGFYTKIDPAFDDIFTCIIDNGYNYSCQNGGELKTTAI
jgi:hypothetical protein